MITDFEKNYKRSLAKSFIFSMLLFVLIIATGFSILMVQYYNKPAELKAADNAITPANVVEKIDNLDSQVSSKKETSDIVTDFISYINSDDCSSDENWKQIQSMFNESNIVNVNWYSYDSVSNNDITYTVSSKDSSYCLWITFDGTSIVNWKIFDL